MVSYSLGNGNSLLIKNSWVQHCEQCLGVITYSFFSVFLDFIKFLFDSETGDASVELIEYWLWFSSIGTVFLLIIIFMFYLSFCENLRNIFHIISSYKIDIDGYTILFLPLFYLLNMRYYYTPMMLTFRYSHLRWILISRYILILSYYLMKTWVLMFLLSFSFAIFPF